MPQTTTFCDQQSLILNTTVGLLNPYDPRGTATTDLRILLSNMWLVGIPQKEFCKQVWIQQILLPERLLNPLFGHDNLDTWLRELSFSAPPIEQVWKITEKFPSLSRLLSEERENE